MMGGLLYNEINEFQFKKKKTERRVSTELKVQNLEVKVEKGKRKAITHLRVSPSSSQLLAGGDMQNRFAENQLTLSADLSPLAQQNISFRSKRGLKSKVQEGDEIDWRAIHKPLQVSEDSKEHITMAKGKEIRRTKEETRHICISYINEFAQSQAARRSITDEFSKETFW